MSATGENLPRNSRIPISPTSVPASPSQLAVITGKGPAVRMVRGSVPSGAVAEADLRRGRVATCTNCRVHLSYSWLSLVDLTRPAPDYADLRALLTNQPSEVPSYRESSEQ